MSLPDTIGKYQVVEELGRGHFGQVVRVYDRVLQVERALKILSTNQPHEFLQAFKEAEIMEKCRHANIVDIRDADIEIVDGRPTVCIVMEYLPRGSAQKELSESFMSVRRACQLVGEALLALEHAHDRGVLHRDVKPGNIMISDTGHAKLSDFGLATDYARYAPDFQGYVTHLAPEALILDRQDPISDIYAMGVTLYRMLNNRVELNHTYASRQEFVNAVQRGRFPPRQYLPHIPTQVTRVVGKALRPDPALRFANCQEFRQSLERLHFYMDWNTLDENTWRGEYKGDVYTCEIRQRREWWDFEFTKNGRRVRSMCLRYDTRVEAEQALIDQVRNSTLQ